MYLIRPRRLRCGEGGERRTQLFGRMMSFSAVRYKAQKMIRCCMQYAEVGGGGGGGGAELLLEGMKSCGHYEHLPAYVPS